jgi:hypothetical protein
MPGTNVGNIVSHTKERLIVCIVIRMLDVIPAPTYPLVLAIRSSMDCLE